MASVLNPIEATEAIRQAYERYLLTTFNIANPQLRQQFSKQLQEPEWPLVKGPLLEVTPAFETAKTVEDLIEDGLLHEDWRLLDEGSLPRERPLYVHQQTAIEKAVRDRRNLIIATGTASGKTEAFLIPILDKLLRERAKGPLGPGVRALLLYPMNALANDQLTRLRRLLTPLPDITFGRYTGDTRTEDAEAEEQFHQNFPDHDRISNELISRNQMRQTPPHLLLTNYAMLEYLLLRPEDNVFFDGEFANQWRFLVLDEVHIYDGAQGIETAMLLRRLKDRVVDGQRGVLQCFGCSATIGGEDRNEEVIRFAETLFDERFEWVSDSQYQQDVIEARRVQHISPQYTFRPEPELYGSLSALVAQTDPGETAGRDVVSYFEHLPEEVLLASKRVVDLEGPLAEVVYEVLKHDERIAELHAFLADGPKLVTDLAQKLMPGLPLEQAREALVQLVRLARIARPRPESNSLLPARYHVFVRATEGAFVALGLTPQLFTKPRREWTDASTGATWPVFEAARCRNCGALYIAGREQGGGAQARLVQCSNTADWEAVNYYLVCDRGINPVFADREDEDSEPAAVPDEDAYVLARGAGQSGEETPSRFASARKDRALSS